MKKKREINRIGWPMAWLMAVLFAGGLLFCGAEWEYGQVPWGQVIGISMLVAMLFLIRLIERGGFDNEKIHKRIHHINDLLDRRARLRDGN